MRKTAMQHLLLHPSIWKRIKNCTSQQANAVHLPASSSLAQTHTYKEANKHAEGIHKKQQDMIEASRTSG